MIWFTLPLVAITLVVLGPTRLVGVARLASRWRRPEAPDVRRASRPEEADVLLALSALTVLAVLAPPLARLRFGRELGYVFAAGFAWVAILLALGRVSCRARVCQTVLLSVVHVSLPKQN